MRMRGKHNFCFSDIVCFFSENRFLVLFYGVLVMFFLSAIVIVKCITIYAPVFFSDSKFLLFLNVVSYSGSDLLQGAIAQCVQAAGFVDTIENPSFSCWLAQVSLSFWLLQPYPGMSCSRSMRGVTIGRVCAATWATMTTQYLTFSTTDFFKNTKKKSKRI